MASRQGLMTSGWLIFIVLAGLGTADILSPETASGLSDLEPLFSIVTFPRGRPEGSAYHPVHVWKFLKGKKLAQLTTLRLQLWVVTAVLEHASMVTLSVPAGANC